MRLTPSKLFYYLLVLSVAIISILLPLNVKTAEAHRSGCHRWHSCPSDTGSYVCGDLGYYTYCGYGPTQTPTPKPTPRPAPAPLVENRTTEVSSDEGEITADVLRVRTGPGLTYGVIDGLQRSTRVAILERQSGWLRVRYSNSKTGWVSADYVRQDTYALPSSTAMPEAGVHLVAGYQTPVLITPKDGQGVHDPIVFEWRWQGSLKAGEGFDVQVWRDGESPAGVAHPSFVVHHGDEHYTLQVHHLNRPPAQTYFWSVKIVTIETGRSLSHSAMPATFQYD